MLYKLSPYLSISDTWVLLWLFMDLWLVIIFKKFYQGRTLTLKLSPGSHSQDTKDVQDVREDFSVYHLVNSFSAAIFVPGSVL